MSIRPVHSSETAQLGHVGKIIRRHCSELLHKQYRWLRAIYCQQTHFCGLKFTPQKAVIHSPFHHHLTNIFPPSQTTSDFQATPSSTLHMPHFTATVSSSCCGRRLNEQPTLKTCLFTAKNHDKHSSGDSHDRHKALERFTGVVLSKKSCWNARSWAALQCGQNRPEAVKSELPWFHWHRFFYRQDRIYKRTTKHHLYTRKHVQYAVQSSAARIEEFGGVFKKLRRFEF